VTLDARATGPHTAMALLLCLLVLMASGGAGPLAQVSDLPEEPLPRAQALIRDRNTSVGVTPGYKVYSDDPRLDTKKAAELLDSFRAQFERDWSAFPGRKKDEPPAHVFLFYSRFKYAQLQGASVRQISPLDLGHYHVLADIIALQTDFAAPDDLPDALVHEATHQLTQMTLLGPGVYGSPWLMEGLAEYYGNMKSEPKTGYQPGRFGGKGTWLFHDGANRGRGVRGGMREDELKQYRKELSKGVAAPVEVLVGMRDPAQFLSEGSLMRYTASWMLVHFLMQGEGGRHRAGFMRYIAKEAAGEPGAAAFYEALGLQPDELQKAFEDHVKHPS
jgi:hypothetical protein